MVNVRGRMRAALPITLSVVCLGCGNDERLADQPDAAPAEPSSAWGSFGANPEHTRANLAERALTADHASGLLKAWTADATGSTSTPAVVDGVVYWTTLHGDLVATRADTGADVWRKSLASGFTASPLVADGVVYVGDSVGTMHAVRASTGEVVWSSSIAATPPDEVELAGLKFTVPTMLFSSPALAGDTLVIGVASAPFATTQLFRGQVVGLDTAKGAEKWRLDVTRHGGEEYAVGVSVWSSAAIDVERRLAFIGTGQSYAEPASPLSDALLAIHTDTGELAWSKQFTPGDFYTFELLVSMTAQGEDFDVGAAPNAFSIDGRDVVGVGDKSGMYYVHDRETGDLVWGRELTTGSALGGVMTAAAVAEDVVYVASNTWNFWGSNLSLVDIPFTDPRNRCEVLALDALDEGEVLWRRDFDSVCIGGVAWAAGVVYVAATNGVVRALRASDGSVLFEAEVSPDGVAGGVSVSEGRLFVPHGWAFALGFDAPTDMVGGVTAFGLP